MQWKVCLFGIWFRVPNFIGNVVFKTNFIRICDIDHIIGRNLKEVMISNKKYVLWENEQMSLD